MPEIEIYNEMRFKFCSKYGKSEYIAISSRISKK